MNFGVIDFLEKPYVRGLQYFRWSIEEGSLQERITKLAIAILLWIPFINIGGWFFCNKFYSLPPLLTLSPYFLPLSESEQKMYRQEDTSQVSSISQLKVGKIKHSVYGFNYNYSRLRLMKLYSHKKGVFQNFDLRIIPATYADFSRDTKTYCLFKIDRLDTRIVFPERNLGRLVLSCTNQTLWIERIDNLHCHGSGDPKYRLGSALMQLAIEVSLKNGCEGNVSLVSSGPSAGFYHRLGFVCKDSTIEREVVEEYRRGKSTLAGGLMFLSKAAIDIWKRKIRENPIITTEANKDLYLFAVT